MTNDKTQVCIECLPAGELVSAESCGKAFSKAVELCGGRPGQPFTRESLLDIPDAAYAKLRGEVQVVPISGLSDL